MDWAYYFVLMLVLLFGWIVNAAGLPGLWIMVAAAALYALVTRWAYLGFRTVLVLIAIALVAEVVETVAGGAGARRAGGSKRGVVGAVVGGLVGALVGSFVIPIFIVGTIVGACLGSLLGATLVELSIGREMAHSLRIGVGAAKGRLLGIVSKLAFGFIMFLITLYTALPWVTAPAVTSPPPASTPSTTPTPAITSSAPI